jgi:DNA-binding NtrC family response regulator
MLDARHFDGVLTAAASPGVPQAVPDAAGSPGPAQRAAEPQRRSEPSMAVRPLPEQVAELERQAIARALQATGGNRLAAARLLRMSRAAFYDRLARYPELGTCGRSI